MNFMELMNTRYSVRKYSDRPVEAEKLRQVLEAGRLAPTAGNKQPQRVYVFESEAALNKLRGMTRMTYGAPAVLLVCYDDAVSWKSTVATFGEDYEGGEVDAAIVTTAMMLQAAELGLGTIWTRGFDSRALCAALELPESEHIVAMLPVGYAAEDSKPLAWHFERKPLEETVRIL